VISKRSVLACLAGALWLGASPALADSIVFTGIFTPDGGNGRTGSGTATVTIDTDTAMMRVQAEFSGLSGTTSSAHIHCCTELSGTGNAGVASVTPTFTNFPAGVMSGAYDFTYDMNQAASFNATFITANGGSPGTALAALLAGLETQRAYFNIHTSTFSGGEIRAVLAPEPAGMALLGLGLALLARRVRSLRAPA